MSIELVESPEEFQERLLALRSLGESVGLVPTMGALHAGHLALMREAGKRASFVAATIFVNPTQFGPAEDFEKYPRRLEEDLLLCAQAGVKLVFAPKQAAMYAPGEATRVQVGRLSQRLCGASRPGHFEGVATVVTKLLVLAGPCTAVFGRKDYQQLKVIERLVQDLFLPVVVVGHPTVREGDGLALSSRNAYLSASERLSARAIPEALSFASRTYGSANAEGIRASVEAALKSAGLRVDYVELAHPETLEAVSTMGKEEPVLLAVAAFAGNTRLIDNLVLGRDAPPLAG